MPNVIAPRGFKSVRLFDGSPHSGAINTYRLPSGYATNLFVGDAVKLLSTGYVAKAAPGDQFRGIVAGFRFVQAGQPLNTLRYFAAGTTSVGGQDIEVQVIDDPRVLFEAQFVNSASVPAVADIGACFNLADLGGNAATAQSGEGIDYSTSTAGAAQFRLVEFVRRPDNDTASANSRGLFAPVLHDYRVNAGI